MAQPTLSSSLLAAQGSGGNLDPGNYRNWFTKVYKAFTKTAGQHPSAPRAPGTRRAPDVHPVPRPGNIGDPRGDRCPLGTPVDARASLKAIIKLIPIAPGVPTAPRVTACPMFSEIFEKNTDRGDPLCINDIGDFKTPIIVNILMALYVVYWRSQHFPPPSSRRKAAVQPVHRRQQGTGDLVYESLQSLYEDCGSADWDARSRVPPVAHGCHPVLRGPGRHRRPCRDVYPRNRP